MPKTRMRRLSLQQLFNKSVRGLKRQHFKAAFDEELDACVYFDPKTKRRCAIGQLLTVEQAKECPSGAVTNAQVWPSVSRRLGSGGPGFVPGSPGYSRQSQQKNFLSDLQEAHDSAEGPEDMKDRLRRVAEQFGLKTTAVS